MIKKTVIKTLTIVLCVFSILMSQTKENVVSAAFGGKTPKITINYNGTETEEFTGACDIMECQIQNIELKKSSNEWMVTEVTDGIQYRVRFSGETAFGEYTDFEKGSTILNAYNDYRIVVGIDGPMEMEMTLVPYSPGKFSVGVEPKIFSTLKEAITEANGSDDHTITLLDNADISEEKEIDLTGITIDFGEYSITSSKNGNISFKGKYAYEDEGQDLYQLVEHPYFSVGVEPKIFSTLKEAITEANGSDDHTITLLDNADISEEKEIDLTGITIEFSDFNIFSDKNDNLLNSNVGYSYVNSHDSEHTEYKLLYTPYTIHVDSSCINLYDDKTGYYDNTIFDLSNDGIGAYKIVAYTLDGNRIEDIYFSSGVKGYFVPAYEQFDISQIASEIAVQLDTAVSFDVELIPLECDTTKNHFSFDSIYCNETSELEVYFQSITQESMKLSDELIIDELNVHIIGNDYIELNYTNLYVNKLMIEGNPTIEYFEINDGYYGKESMYIVPQYVPDARLACWDSSNDDYPILIEDHATVGNIKYKANNVNFYNLDEAMTYVKDDPSGKALIIMQDDDDEYNDEIVLSEGMTLDLNSHNIVVTNMINFGGIVKDDMGYGTLTVTGNIAFIGNYSKAKDGAAYIPVRVSDNAYQFFEEQIAYTYRTNLTGYWEENGKTKRQAVVGSYLVMEEGIGQGLPEYIFVFDESGNLTSGVNLGLKAGITKKTDTNKDFTFSLNIVKDYVDRFTDNKNTKPYFKLVGLDDATSITVNGFVTNEGVDYRYDGKAFDISLNQEINKPN